MLEDPGSGIAWSHDALQQAELWYPLRDLDEPEPHATYLRYVELEAALGAARNKGDFRIAERIAQQLERFGGSLHDPARPANVLIRELHSASGPGDRLLARLPPLTLGAVAFWLSGTPPTLGQAELGDVLAAAALGGCEAVLAAVVLLDDAAGQPEPATRMPPNDQDDMLARALDEGLDRLEGRRLLGLQPTLYFHLLSRGYRPARLRLCERCQLVHDAPRARTCRRCRRSPVRVTPKPWHSRIILGTRTQAEARAELALRAAPGGRTLIVARTLDRRPSRTIYIARCQDCGKQFRSHHAATRYCAHCAAPRTRVARSRRSNPSTRPDARDTA